MRRQFFVLLLLSLLLAVPAYAQMTDAAVAEYVKNGIEAGRSKQDIAKELIARGVTREQAERIHKNYVESNAQNSNEAVRNAGRQELQRRTDDGLNSDGMHASAAENSVVAQVSATSDARQVFGRNVFNNTNLTFAPSANLPTPPNYRLGPGDEVIIDIWGANEATIRSTISPEGTLNVPHLGLVSLNGMTVQEADAYMRRMLGRIYSVDGSDAKSEIKLTLGNLRTIQVNVMGEVAVPGTYSLSSFSNVYHALYRAGGVSDLGSLRDIRLCRGGRTVASLDVYEFIFSGKSSEGLLLEEGDIIIVPAYDRLVDISGNVKRPMLYEMKSGETLSDLLRYSGGFTGDAYRGSLGLVRQNGREYRVYTVKESDYPVFSLMDGDAVSVGAMLDRYENRVEVKGAVYRPGIYQLCEEISTVKQLVETADGLKGDAFTGRALLQREKDDLTLEVLPIDLLAVMDGTAQDIALRKNDILFVSSVHDLSDIGYVSVMGEVARPGQFIFAENTTLEDIIMQAGGLLESASVVKVDVSRRIKDPSSTEATDSLARLYTFRLKDGFVIDGEPGFVLSPYDQVYVRRSPGYRAQAHVEVGGQVLFPGTYTLSSRSERLSEAVAKAGGVLQWAYLKGAKLRRIANADERARMETLAGLAVKENSRDSLDIALHDISGTYYIGIDLEAALANPGGDADIVLRDGDRIEIPELNGTVKISGNVMYPNVVSYDSSMRVKDYVEMAGGYGFRSKRSKAYIVYMNGTVARAKAGSRAVVEPGCEIVVPKKSYRGTSLQEILGVATTASSLATMMATITNLIK